MTKSVYILLIFPENSIFSSPSYCLHTTHLAHNRCSEWDWNKPIWQSAMQLGRLGTYLLFLLSTCRINHEPKIISPGTKLCTLGGNMIQQVRLSLTYSNTCSFIYLFLAQGMLILLLQKYGLPQKLSYLWVIKLVVSRNSQTTACSNWSWLMGYYKIHSQDQILSAYFPMHCWARFLPGPLANGAGSYCPLKALLFLDRCWILFLR